jgi:hypothetical protein
MMIFALIQTFPKARSLISADQDVVYSISRRRRSIIDPGQDLFRRALKGLVVIIRASRSQWWWTVGFIPYTAILLSIE